MYFRHTFQNPIVRLYFYFLLTLSIILSNTFESIAVFGIIVVIIAIKNYHKFQAVLNSYLPTLLFFPIVLVIYLLFSNFLSSIPFFDSLIDATKAFLKFSLMIISMNYYLVKSNSEKLINAFRTIWVKGGLPWEWVDNLFLFLSLSLRFYPTFQSQWRTQRDSQKALGIKFKNSFISKVVDLSYDLTSMLFQQLKRSEEIALAMKLRGYGKSFPRKTANPQNFNLTHLFQTFIITFSFYTLLRFVSI